MRSGNNCVPKSCSFTSIIPVAAENKLSRGQVAGLSVSLAFVAVALCSVLLWFIIRRFRQKSRDRDTTTATTSYVTLPFPQRQISRSESDYRDDGQPNPLPSVRHGSAYDLDCPATQTNELLVNGHIVEYMEVNPAYSTVSVGNLQNERPTAEPETCH